MHVPILSNSLGFSTRQAARKGPLEFVEAGAVAREIKCTANLNKYLTKNWEALCNCKSSDSAVCSCSTPLSLDLAVIEPTVCYEIRVRAHAVEIHFDLARQVQVYQV